MSSGDEGPSESGPFRPSESDRLESPNRSSVGRQPTASEFEPSPVGVVVTPQGGLAGDGWLFVRMLGVGGPYEVERVALTGFSGHVIGLDAETSRPLAAAIDGVPFSIASSEYSPEENEWRIDVRRASQHLVAAVAPGGGLIREVNVSKPASYEFFAGTRPNAPPLVLLERNVIAKGDGITWLPQTVSPGYLWVGAPHHSYTLLSSPSGEPAYVEEVLETAADVQVRITARGPLSAYRITVDANDAPPRVIDDLESRDVTLRGLPEGRSVIALGSNLDPQAEPYCRIEVPLVSGTVPVVELDSESAGSSLDGEIQGVLIRGDAALSRFLFEESVVKVYPVAREDGSAIAKGKAKTIPFDAMVVVDSEQRYHWSAANLAPGGYRVEVAPFGVYTNVWVPPGGSAYATLSLSELAVLRVNFVDQVTGQAADVTPTRCTLVEPHESHGVAFRPSGRLFVDPEDGSVVYIGLPGEVSIGIAGPAYGEFNYPALAPPGSSRLDARIPRAFWVNITFARRQNGEIVGARWYGTIEIFDGESWRTPRWFASSTVERGTARRVRMCVTDHSEFDVRFVPDEGFPPVSPARVPFAEEAGQEPSGFAQRDVRVVIEVDDERSYPAWLAANRIDIGAVEK